MVNKYKMSDRRLILEITLGLLLSGIIGYFVFHMDKKTFDELVKTTWLMPD